MKRFNNEKGMVMVEATIYFPLVLCTVMFLIYLALFNMQGYMLTFEAQRIAAVAAREEAYLGYDNLNMGANQEIDFNWGSAQGPSSDQITSYYKAHHEHLASLYREVGDIWHLFSGANGKAESFYESKFADAGRKATLLALGTVSDPKVDIEYNLLGTEVTVEIQYRFPTPGVIRYLGVDNFRGIHSVAYTYSINPGTFVRNVDLAVDLTAYVLDKFGIDYSGFVSQSKEVLAKIL